jgi:hypothetical protein
MSRFMGANLSDHGLIVDLDSLSISALAVKMAGIGE